MSTEKTRNISIYDYFEKLQLEYACAHLRSKIYPKRRDREYYRDRVMKGKEEKIKNISLNNNGLPNIFNDEGIKTQIYNKIWRVKGFPHFIYFDSAHKEEFESKDFQYYYAEGEQFKIYREEGDIDVGILVSIDEENELAHLKARGSAVEEVVPLAHLSRIL